MFLHSYSIQHLLTLPPCNVLHSRDALLWKFQSLSFTSLHSTSIQFTLHRTFQFLPDHLPFFVFFTLLQFYFINRHSIYQHFSVYPRWEVNIGPTTAMVGDVEGSFANFGLILVTQPIKLKNGVQPTSQCQCQLSIEKILGNHWSTLGK